jgi:hypothetical protein
MYLLPGAIPSSCVFVPEVFGDDKMTCECLCSGALEEVCCWAALEEGPGCLLWEAAGKVA